MKKQTKPKREPATGAGVVNARPLRHNAGGHKIRLGGKPPPKRRGPREVGLSISEGVEPAPPERGDEAIVARHR